MALTVLQVTTRARDLHPALSFTNAPQVLAYRQLSAQQRDLIAVIATSIPAYLADRVTITMPLASFDAGVDLATLIPGGWLDLLDLFMTYTGDSSETPRTVRAKAVPWEQRDMSQRVPGWTFRHNTLLLLGKVADYANYTEGVLTYTPLGTDLTADASTFLLPDDAREWLAAELAVYWLSRMVGLPQAGVTGDVVGVYVQRAQVARQALLTRIRSLGMRQDYRIRDVT
jgi:hypothetical protein